MGDPTHLGIGLHDDASQPTMPPMINVMIQPISVLPWRSNFAARTLQEANCALLLRRVASASASLAF
ncbi:MAG: hypothetical protein ACM3KD_07365 [Hyphomicrobiaceae bacterium]